MSSGLNRTDFPKALTGIEFIIKTLIEIESPTLK